MNANPADRDARRSVLPSAFTLVEMLVVIGIIGMLIALLLPSLNKANAQAQRVKCMSNLKQIGDAMLIYAETANGYLFPPDTPNDPMGWPTQTVPASDPNYGFNPPPNTVEGTNPPQFHVWSYFVFNRVWNPPVMVCPSDIPSPDGQHSYLVNAYLLPKSMDNISATNPSASNDVKYSTPLPPGHTPSDVIVVGEKKSNVFDYYMDPGDFAPDNSGKVEEYRHGLRLGSNYLMLDMHVETQVPTNAVEQVNPWPVFN